MSSPLQIRASFPSLRRSINGKALTYLDSAATTQEVVNATEAMRGFSDSARGNVHRGMHILAEESTDAYEGARETVRTFIHAAHADEIIFTKGTTESINLVARSLDGFLKEGDVIALSILEHHSNIVPWQQLSERTGATIIWIDINEDGTLNEESLQKALTAQRLKFVAITGLSNVLGIRPDLKRIVTVAHAKSAWVLIDAAQLVAHDSINVQTIDCDFLAFSGHKIYGPTGIGVLYGKRKILKQLPPFLGGGNMITEVTTEGFTATEAPARFEAGTPPIAQAIGLAAAIEWLQSIPLNDRRAHEQALLTHARTVLETISGLSILCPSPDAEGVVSFVIDGIHPHDLTSILGQEGICLRAGHHCTQPLHRRLGIVASTRLSVALYNTTEEIDHLPDAITRAIQKLR